MMWKSFVLMGGAAVFCSCSTMKSLHGPIADNGFDPLEGPGGPRLSMGGEDLGLVDFLPETEVETAMPNSVLYYQYPRRSSKQPDVVMPQGVPLVVVSTKKLYVKVRDKEGREGFVPNVMLAPRGVISNERPVGYQEITPVPGEEPPAVPEPAPDVPPVPDELPEHPLEPPVEEPKEMPA